MTVERLASRPTWLFSVGSFGDNRDWPKIDAWADGIARTLRERNARAS